MGFIDSNDDRDGVDYYECEIPLVHGDEFLKQKNIKNVDVLKIDVEGYEPTVLKGLRNTILVNRPLLLVEYTKDTHVACNSSFEEFKRLFPNNYKFQAVKKRLPKYKAFPARQVCFLEDVGDTPYYGNIICTPCDT